MPGSGRTHKQFYLNLGKETVAFDTEATSWEATSGPIQELPDEEFGYEELKVTKHDELGANHKILQGKFKGKFTYTVSIENFKPFYHILGGLIEQPHILVVDTETEFTAGEGVFLATTTTQYGVVDSVATGKITLKKFVINEVVTGAGGGTGTVERIVGNVMYIKKVNTTAFVDDEIITGTDSGAVCSLTATGVSVETIVPGVIEQLTLEQPSDSDDIADLASSASDATISNIIYSHYIFAWRDAPSYSMEFVYEDLSIADSEGPQKLMTGCVMDGLSFDVVSNDIPKLKESWMVATSVDEQLKSTKQTNATTTLYEWTNIPSSGILVNGVDYTNLFKTLSIEIKRKLGTILGNSRNPKSFKGPTTEYVLKLGVHRQDIVERSLVRNWGTAVGAAVPGIFTFNRGVALEDATIITFPTVRIPDLKETVGDETILQDLTMGIEGTCTVQTYDDIQFYGSSA